MARASEGSFWKTVGAFAIVGPPVGGLILVVLVLLSVPNAIASTRPYDLLALPMAAVAGYPFGIVPAALTGVVAGAVSTWIPSKSIWVMCSMIAGAVFSWIAMSILTGTQEFSVLFIGIGSAAGLISALVGLQFRPRWSN